ncbi:MAG: hypothetical protein HY301_04280 [Verrucomicrobia bacterium]|nr:hypothetical protein [Verrucomicrobiota bacterium]
MNLCPGVSVFIGCLVVAAAGGGCVNTPSLRDPFISSRPLPNNSLNELLRPGMPRAEVTAELGRPLFELEDGRLLGYVWEKNFITSETANTGYTLSQEVARRSWGLWVEVDDKGGVVRHFYGKVGTDRTVGEQALEWFRRGPGSTSKPPSP